MWVRLGAFSGVIVPHTLGRGSDSVDVWDTSSNEDLLERSDNEDNRFSETETEGCHLNMWVRGTVERLRETVSSLELFAEVAGLLSPLVGV